MIDPCVWAEIDLDAFAYNCCVVKDLISSGTKFMAVVKADGYGHGAVAVSKVAIRCGADFLGVARIEEAIELRKNNISTPILIFGYTPYKYTDELLKYDITQTIYNIDQAKALSNIVTKKGKKLKCHIKVDTGMGRLGIVTFEDIDKAISEVEEILNLEGLDVEGIYTHFAKSDTDPDYTMLQIDRFLNFLNRLDKKGICPSIKHAANSAAIVHFPSSHFDMVRAGIMLYGVYPSMQSKEKIELKPVMTLKSKVVMVKEVKPGFKVSYGSTYRTTKKTKLATISVGYADGYPRLLSSKADVLIKGKRVKVAGRVCMDYTVVDVGDLDVKPEEEVILFGGCEKNSISVEEIAQLSNTIGYEILTGISKRVKRIYKGQKD